MVSEDVICQSGDTRVLGTNTWCASLCEMNSQLRPLAGCVVTMIDRLLGVLRSPRCLQQGKISDMDKYWACVSGISRKFDQLGRVLFTFSFVDFRGASR